MNHGEPEPDKQTLLEWLPMAANGTLSPGQRAQLEAGLARYPALRHELRWLQALRQTVQEEPLDPLPSGDLGWSRLAERIAPAPHRRAAAQDPPLGWAARLREWLQARAMPALATACVLLVAQAVLIGTLVRQEATYEAAGAGAPVEGAVPGLLLHVAVRPGITELQLRGALRRFDASIVQGPSALGIYTLRVTDGTGQGDARQAAQRLMGEAGDVFESAAPTEGE